MDELAPDARRVIELGAGTGAMTRAPLARGVAPQDLLVLELNPQLAEHLGRMFPRRPRGCAPTRATCRRKWRGSAGRRAGRPDAVVSSLGLLSMPASLQQEILSALL